MINDPHFAKSSQIAEWMDFINYYFGTSPSATITFLTGCLAEPRSHTGLPEMAITRFASELTNPFVSLFKTGIESPDGLINLE